MVIDNKITDLFAVYSTVIPLLAETFKKSAPQRGDTLTVTGKTNIEILSVNFDWYRIIMLSLKK